MRIRALKNTVIVTLFEIEKKKSPLILSEPVMRGRVVDRGEDFEDYMDEGDVLVLWSSKAGTPFQVGDETFVMLTAHDILAVLEEDIE